MAVNFPLAASFQSLDDNEKFSSPKRRIKRQKQIPERIPLSKLFFERQQRFFWRADETQNEGELCASTL